MENSPENEPPSSPENEDSDCLKAGTVYVILKKSYYVPRSLRIQWYLQHLNTKIKITLHEKNSDDETVVASIVPEEPTKDWSVENGHLFEYLVTLSTNVIFLGEVNRVVYCLDISPSVSSVDSQYGEVLLDVIIESLQKSITSLVSPFYIPGSSHEFKPDIFITVIAHTPFFISPAQQVLVQGWKITKENLNEFLGAVLRQLEFIEDEVARVSGSVHEQFEVERKKSTELENINKGSLNDDVINQFFPITPNIAMVSPASGFLNLLRFGMLALKLLPVSNSSNLVVITDGMIAMPDSDTLDSVLNHMRYNDISCNFIHVGSHFHPHCGFGFVPYAEIMQLISVATNGSYFQFSPHHKQQNGLNIYQQNFLTWSLKRKSVVLELSTPHAREGDWMITNTHFYGNRGPQLLTKKYLENNINVTLYGVLACRIREGFILNELYIKDNELIINFILPWTNHIYIEYTSSSQWPVITSPSISTHFVINIKAPYEFLHDISCHMKTPIKSPFRQALIARFWRSLKSFAQSDLLLSHLESFMNIPSSYFLPEGLKSGMSLYYLMSGSCQPILTSNDIGFTQFGGIWRPACLLNNNLWQKWFHADRVGIIFQHDELINLFSERSKKCTGVQCRLATNTLFKFLKHNTSFALIENHSFIKFLLPSESGTGKHSFYVIRSICKPPYAVIHIAFLYNIPGSVRSKIIREFKRSLGVLEISRPLQKESSYDIFAPGSNCCIILEKPLEKILIRYEQMPSEFSTVVFPDGTQPSNKAQNLLSSNRGLITTLSRYLHHRRWIWKANINRKIFLPVQALENILSTLVKIRLQEGFYFAHFSAGICNMVLEVQMKGSTKENVSTDGIYYNYHEDDDSEELHSCIIQYVLFPPRTVETPLREGEEPDSREFSVIELVSECWIEPQHGVITNCPPTRSYMSNLQYHELPDAIWSVDAKCISALCTFEHLRVMCENPGVEAPDSIQHLLSKSNPSAYWPNVAPFEDQRISHIPFPYTVPNLLCQCVQENLLYNIFSIDLLDKSESSCEPNKLLLDSVYNHLSTVHSKELLICGQDAQYLIKNFRRSSRSSEKRHMSSSMIDLEEPLTPHLPSSRDWDRMICWALGRSDSNDSDKKENLTSSRNSIHARHDMTENESKFRRSFMSDFNGSHYSSNFDISSISYLENVDWLKWKCYVKFVSKSQCIVTVLPANLDVIKKIALDQEQRNSQLVEHSHLVHDNVSGSFDAESRVSENVDDVTCSSIATSNHTRIDNNSVYTSCSFSSKDLIGDDNVYDETADMSTELAKDSEINTAFRLRASTWDPVRRVMDSHMNADDRLRTNSVGARARPLGGLRPKRSFDFESKEKLYCFENANKITKFVPLILPVYVYNCTMPDVINYLIYKDKYAHFEKQDVSFENNDSLDDTLTQIRKNYQDSALGEYNLDEQCNSIDTVFTKFFVLSLFKCLHHGYEIPLSDVEQGFSKCETSVLTIDITEYLKVVCRHLRNLVPTKQSSDKEETPPKCTIPVQNFLSSGVCNELRFIHRLIKKKFANILTSDFKPIPSKPEFYYFFPSWTKESKPSSAGILSPGFAENNSSAVSVDQIMPVNSANILGINTWDTCKESVNSEDNACTSLISNMDSDSLNEISNESLMDDVNPLFLRVDCKMSSNGRIAKCSLHLIPTCICEVLRCLDKSFSDVDISDLKVTLELLYLTSPFTDGKKKLIKTADISKGAGFIDETNKVNVYEDVEALSFDEGRVPRQIMSLPDYQYNALNTCIAQMKWLIKDEIITFMLDASPVTPETLKMVCEHVESSPNAATCFIEKVPLSFVFGNETTSLNNFLEAFDSMKIPYYRLKKLNNMYYLVKDFQERNNFIKENLEEKDEIGNAADKFLSSSMDILAEEQENFFQVFSSNESISENESIKIINTVQRQESITDAEEDNNRMLQSTVQWILDRDSSNVEMPNFWLIMTITNNYVIVYFHCRFLEINKKEIKDYVLVRESVISNIKDLCKVVNQKMLLNSLHDTRVCDQLLEPDSQNDDSENETPNQNTEINYAFVPGYFACNVVWETKFILHPRLKMSPLKSSVSRGIQALCSALSGFSVTNRKNLFVYQDVNKNVFYLRLYESVHGVLKSHEGEETSLGSFSRSSSFTSLNKKHFDEQLPFMLDETKSRNKSASDNSESNMSKVEDYIALRVYGITETGKDIKSDLVQVLQNRLDDAVLDVISVMLSRNPLCKLLSEDVHFIQKPYQHPSTILQFNVDVWVMKHLYTFRYLIKQNIQQFASSPKYSDPRSSYHFQDYSVPEDSPKRVSESDIFLYNQNPTCGKGIACLAVAIVDANHEAIECNDDYDPNIRYTLNFFPINELKSMTNVEQGLNESENCVKVEFRIWKQGRINMEILEPKLMSAIRHSLWELVMEKISLVYPLFDGDSDHLFRAYYSVMPHWMSFGMELTISSVRVWDFALPVKLNLPIILKELNQIFSPYETACYAFYKHHHSDELEEVFTPCINFNEVMEHGGDTCLMIGRSMTYLQNALDHGATKMTLEPVKSDKGLQRVPSTTQDDSFTAVMKQRFILFMIANSKITVYAYNWSKDKIESITKLLTNLSEWIVARSYLLTSIVEQKMGIFFNHPLQRPNISKKVVEMAKLDINVLFKFPIVYQKNNSGIPLYSVSETFRDVKLPNDLKEKLADRNSFTQNVNQLIEINEINKKNNQKNLFSSWQLKGSSSSIPVSEEMLNNFLLHGRLIHFCLTPLLFMPRWRVAAAATRDHSLSLKTQSLEKNEDSLPSDDEEKWHSQICANFIHEYKQYLQCLGFFPVQPTESSSKKQNTKANNSGDDKNVHYMQKFPHGGVLLFELFFAEPFFNAKLYALDYSMLKAKSSSLMSQFAVSFLDECDRIKFQMHLHSFTYDYHLRCLHEYIADRQPLLRHGYHIIEFLDDFIKYYPKASNYARSLVHAENITVENVTISPPQLFDYLLTHGKNYNMVPFCMVPQTATSGSTEGVNQNQYVLIQNKHKSGVSYKDANDVQQTDDFDITVIISYINGDELVKTMQFQVYILLTTRRELYPKVEVEQKLGKFRTVSTSHDHTSPNEDVNMKFTIEPDGSSSSKESQDSKDTKKKKSLPFHVEIKQELVNYLGYYSSHEEVMQNLMQEEVAEAKKYIEWMVMQGAFDCETHMLWNRLLCSLPVPLTYPELQHLLSLAEVLDISNMDSQLENILKQPISWFQFFIKAVMTKLPECCHLFSSPNNATQELLILHPQYSNGFLMIVLNFHTSTAAMYLVYRRDISSEDEARVQLQTLFEQIINMCCFHLWLDAL